MTYDDFISKVSEASGATESTVRKVLSAMPEVLMAFPDGDKTRTPLGVFTLTERKEKAVRTPDGKWSSAPAKVIAKLKSGKKLQREVRDVLQDSPDDD